MAQFTSTFSNYSRSYLSLDIDSSIVTGHAMKGLFRRALDTHKYLGKMVMTTKSISRSYIYTEILQKTPKVQCEIEELQRYAEKTSESLPSPETISATLCSEQKETRTPSAMLGNKKTVINSMSPYTPTLCSESRKRS